MGHVNNLVGQQFTRLTVIARGKTGKQGRAQWICKCTCGNHVVVAGLLLRHGETRSCGCLRKETARNSNNLRLRTTHGMGGTPTYTSYQAAKQRCQNQNNPDYDGYGGRGIQFLYAGFEEFFQDLGTRPPGTTLERCDNHGHYERGNCRWTTVREQNNNTRRNRLLTAFGRTRTMTRWAREMGVNRKTIRARLSRGWPVEDALTRPVRPLKGDAPESEQQ